MIDILAKLFAVFVVKQAISDGIQVGRYLRKMRYESRLSVKCIMQLNGSRWTFKAPRGFMEACAIIESERKL